MGRREKIRSLYEKLGRSRNNVSFTDICTLAEMVGFTFDRQGGSHKIYRHKNPPGIMDFQEVKGKAKPYQVKQLLDFIDDHDLINKEVPDV
jgi:hypothetical protein